MAVRVSGQLFVSELQSIVNWPLLSFFRLKTMPINTQSNGLMSAGGLPPLSIPNSLPHAGNQQDLNYVMNLLNQLSEQVRQNREQTEHIITGVRHIHDRRDTASTTTTQDDLPLPNGDSNTDASPPDQQRQQSTNDLLARIADLEHRLSTLNTSHEAALASASSWQSIATHYESIQSYINTKVRDYTSQCQRAMFSWHHHYLDLLQKEKDANVAMRLEHSKWQESLKKVLEYNREALKARSEELEPFEKERAELRTQNRCYRRLLGLSVAEDEDEQAEELGRMPV